MNSPALRIRIVDVPPGEAPLWVREKWVGLELPLAQGSSQAVTRLTAGVLSGPRSYIAGLIALFFGHLHRAVGYSVKVIKAVQVLEHVSPEAAQWWRTNTPHLFKPPKLFIFQEHVCRVLE